MSPWGWFLLQTLCLLPTGAAPRRGAPASANCELKPQVGRASGAGEAASPHLPWVVTFPSLRSTEPSDPEPPPPAEPFCWRVPPHPGVPFLEGAQSLGRVRPCPQLSPLVSGAEGSPGGVSRVSPACFAGVRGPCVDG